MNTSNQTHPLPGLRGSYRIRRGTSLALLGAAMIVALSSRAALINVDFNGGSYQNGVPYGPTQTGAAAVGAAGDFWNGYIDDAPASRTGEALLDSAGAATTVTMDYSADFNYDSMSWGTSPFVTAKSPVADLLVEFIGASSNDTATITLHGLTPGQYDLYLYSVGDNPAKAQARVTTFRVNGLTNSVGPNNNANTLIEGTNYLHLIPTVAADGLLNIHFNGTASDWEGDLNGFQIRPAVLGTAPLFSSQPTPATVSRFAYGNVTFTAAVDGTQPISLQWRHGSTDIAGATNAVLTLTNLNVADAGSYSLVASNAFGTTNSQLATLTIAAAPAHFVASFDFDCGGDLWPGTYTGPGVLGSGTFWNSVVGPNTSTPGAYASTNSADLDGVTDTGVSLTVVSAGNWAGRGNSTLLNDFACAYTTNGQPFTFTGVADGLYNLVLFGVNAPYSDTRGTIFSVNGVSKATVNATIDPSAFIEGDNYVLFNNLIVTNGVLSGTWAPNPVPHSGAINSEGDFNGAQLQRVGDVNAIVPPTISSQPQSATIYEQRPASFGVSGSGSPAPTYQWQKDGGAIAGATSNVYSLASVMLADAGDYRVVLSNSGGSITSSVARLTVLTAPPAPAAGSFDAAVLTNVPIAFWRLNDPAGTALLYDSVGTHAATNQGISLEAAGPPAQAYPGFPVPAKAGSFDGTTCAATTGASLMNGLSSFTIMGWINPSGPNGDKVGLFGQNDAVEFGYNDLEGVNAWLPTSISGWVNPKTGPDGFAPGEWHFVALVADGRDVAIYVDGTQRGQVSGVGAPVGFSGYGFNIGGAGIFDPTGNYFNGLIADVALFDRALSNRQINDLYNAAAGLIRPSIVTQPSSQSALQNFPVKLTVAAAGTPLAYTWQAGPANGPYTNVLEDLHSTGTRSATLLLPNVTLSQAASYRVIITNLAGSITSDAAAVVVQPLGTPWSVNFDFDCSEGGYVGTYSGAGVLGSGSYWNRIPGPSSWEARTYTSESGLLDDGAIDTQIALWLTTGGSWSYSPVGNALLDDYATADVNGKPFIFNNIPDGLYNLAVFCVDGGWHDRGTIVTVNGQQQITYNASSATFVQGDNYVLFTNLFVSGGSLSGTFAANPKAYGGNNSEGDFAGAQLQFLGPSGPKVILSIQAGANGQITLQWSSGVLLQTTDLGSGSWSPVPNAVSPYTPSANSSPAFYRVKGQ